MAEDEKDPKGPEHAEQGSCQDGDMISVGPNLGGVCPIVRHHADHKIEAGLARIVQPGEQPTGPNPLYLEHRHGNLFAVKPLSKGGSDRATGKSHSKAATPAYRENYENIFGKKPQVGQA